ncbi:MAG: SDR family oxidoreductase [Bauldia sp.]|nr:SDR family oxidoreductase [Bauldia sp.]
MADPGSIALVTGAGSGIGRAVSLALLAAGWRVVLAGRRRDALDETALMAGGATANALAVPTDVSNDAAVGALFDRIDAFGGRLDLCFNNAGFFPKSRPIEDIPFDEWQQAVAVNLTGAFLIAQGAFRMMKAQAPKGGRIINNGSVSAHAPRPNAIAYTATKHALTGLTKSLALDGRTHDIACGQIDIGNAATDLIVTIGEAARARGEATEPTINLDAVADAVLYMANLPLSANVLFTTLIATKMPFVGRG